MVFLRERTRPGLGIIEPCLPSSAKAAPSGPGWLHEIKHDGFRILARRNDAGVQLITRAGNDFSPRFPFIAMAVKSLPVRSCLIDGEAIVCDENGLAVFELIRRHGTIASAMHCAFDLLELDGEDLRRQPVEKRKALLARLAVPIELPFTGGDDVPGRVPAPLIDNEPGPVHGKPVSGFVPVVLGSSPVGIVGETAFSVRGGKTVVFPLSTGLTVFPLSIGLLVFCANTTVVVADKNRMAPNSTRFAAM
jgi:ATP dependent DNA ligase domain